MFVSYPESKWQHSPPILVLMEVSLKNLYFHFIRTRDKNKEKELYPLVHPAKCPQQTELGQAEVRTLELNPGLPCEWQGYKYVSHHLLPLKAALNGKVDGKQRLYSKPAWNQGNQWWKADPSAAS